MGAARSTPLAGVTARCGGGCGARPGLRPPAPNQTRRASTGATATAGAPPPLPNPVAARSLFAAGRVATLERAVGRAAGADAALWASRAFGAEVYPDLPSAAHVRGALAALAAG